MNKTKKIAIAAVSLAMAGTLAFGVFGCTPGGNKPVNKPSVGGPSSSVDLSNFGDVNNIGVGDKSGVVATNADKSINYDSYKNGRQKVTLNMACGNNNLMTSMSFRTLSNGLLLPDGKTYENDDFKPAWQQIGTDLNIGFKDVYLGSATSSNFADAVKATGDSAYTNVDILTTDLSKVITQINAGKSVLNLGDYLDYMPHFKKFLEENPVVYLSLLQAGMQSDGSGKELYVAPYFDGYDDIERYFLIREDWAKKVLNGDTALDTAIPSNTATAVEVEAEFTENYTIKSMNAAGNDFQNITKDYAAAKKALDDKTGALYTAYSAIAGDAATYAGADGNIVTIMNDAMTKGAANATADKLAKLYRAYIDVAYKSDKGTNGYAYTAATRANLFNGYDAAWDVDDLVAIMRILTRAPEALLGNANGKVEGIVSRENNNDRTPDVIRLITSLYGVRGADSRFEYSYIDAENKYQDARLDEDFYNALLKGNKLYKEGLIKSSYYNKNGANYKGAWNSKGAAEGFVMYDYVQTQTGISGFDTETKKEGDLTQWDKDYYLGAVINPVAKWSVSSKDDTIMRFTESWRSTKTGGLALNGSLANNPDKLLAALQLIDYLYSDDGRIVSTFGPMATNAAGDNGFWYNEVAAADATEYFTYKGVKYSGTDYKGEITPTVTARMYNSFLGKSNTIGSATESAGTYNLDNTPNKTTTAAKSFTNYARMLIGSTLPMCVKSQSFEYQCTAKMGRDSAFIVGVAIDMGILNHVTPAIRVSGNTLKGVVAVKEDFSATTKTYKEVNSWYIMVPSGLPTTTIQQNRVDDTTQDNFKAITGDRGSVAKGDYWSFFHVLISDGFTKDYSITGGGSLALSSFADVDALLTNLKSTQGGTTRETTFNQAWQTAVNYCTYLFKA